MLIVLDLFVGLKIYARCCDEYSELPVTKPRYQSRHVFNANSFRWRVALGLKSEVHEDAARSQAQAKLTNGISPSIPGGARDIESGNIRNHQPRKSSGAMLESMRATFEMLADSPNDRLSFLVRRQLLRPASVFQGPGSNERLPSIGLPPSDPGRRRE
jgi:hypothetical protein